MSIEINEKFEKALNLLNTTSKNLFITGKAGTGKSTLLEYFRKNTSKSVVVLAPTGVAAVNIKGETIHSFFRFKPNVTLEEAEKIGKRYNNSELFRNLETIIIDEISMVRADLLDAVDVFLKFARNSTAPFGGVQMVFIGDLYQLPPVAQRDELTVLKNIYPSIYFFGSKIFRYLERTNSKFELVELDKIYRQADQQFIDLLNAVRNKQVNWNHINEINKRYSPTFKYNQEYIYLTTRNDQADKMNFTKLDSLKADMNCYFGKIEGQFERKELPTDVALDLKLGARVMFLNNEQTGLWINGTLGTITELGSEDVKVQIDDGEEVYVEPYKWSLYKSEFNEETKQIERKEVGSFTQLPIKLAWAITIHKSQGKTFDKAVIDLGWGAFSHGQVYVALSRCRSFEGIILSKRVRLADILVDQKVIEFMNSLATS